MPNKKTSHVNQFWDGLFKNKLELLSIAGSVASIVALGIIFLEKFSLERKLPPQIAGWRALFIVLSFFGIVSIAIFSFQWARAAFTNPLDPPHLRTSKAAARIAVGLLMIGICIDGFFAAIYWTEWLYGVPLLLSTFLRGLGW